MDYLRIIKKCGVRLIDVNDNTTFKIQANNGFLKIVVQKDNKLQDVFIDSNTSLINFFKYPAPYFNTELHLTKIGYNSDLIIKLAIKNVPNILDYLNHDQFFIQELMIDFNYNVNQKFLIEYTEIKTPIIESNLIIEPLKKLTLYDYQINNIEKMNYIISKTINVSRSDIAINLQSTDDSLNKIYFNNFDNIFENTKQNVEIKADGLILADEMGLGKTITVISFLKSLNVTDPDTTMLKARGHLIVVPSHLATQWNNEIQKVWENATVKMILTKKDHMAITTKEILNYNFVIITQQFLVNKGHYLNYPVNAQIMQRTPSTFNIDAKLAPFKNIDGTLKFNDLLNIPPVFELITWNNLILDEAHEIMGGLFGNSKAVCNALTSILSNLKGTNKWYVSGTPYNNRLALLNIMNYLNIQIKDLYTFVPWSSSKYKNIVYSKNFLTKMVLRHTKKQVIEQLNLQGTDEKIYWLDQTNIEKQIYQASIHKGDSYLLKLCCHLMVADYENCNYKVINIEDVKNNIKKQSKDKITKYTQLLKNLKNTNAAYHMTKASYTKILSQATFMLQSITQLDNISNKINTDEEECPICLDNITQPTILSCGHIYCWVCISEMTKTTKCCPLCKQVITEKLIKVSYSKKLNNKDNEELINKYGVKTGFLISLVRKLIVNRDNNIIIFSQYDFMLKLISDSLSKNGVLNSFVKGNVFQRNKAIETFRGLRLGKKNQVIMLSLKNAASGTHLVEANHIIFIDPVNSSKKMVFDIENQAIARAYRIGQTKKVHIHRLLIKNTIEETIYNKIYK